MGKEEEELTFEELIEVLKNPNEDLTIRADAVASLYSSNLFKKIRKPSLVEQIVTVLLEEAALWGGIDYEYRFRSYSTIGKKKVIPNLIKNLYAEDKLVRGWAYYDLFYNYIENLGSKLKEKDVEQIIQIINEGGGFEPAGFVEILMVLGKIEIEPLFDFLKHEYSGARGEVAYVLGRLGNKKAIKPLEQALEKEGDFDAMDYIEGSLSILKGE